ncbi:MAG: hypothetical protein ABSB70_02305 [Candidatus Velthaea sp.]
MSLAIAGPLSASDVAQRAAARARGSDRATAVALGRALLADPLPAQLIQIRCERAGAHRICGLVLSGVKFKHPLDRQGFLAEVRALVKGAFSHAALEEVDLWTTVPLGLGKGLVVSGDAAVPTTATVFAVTVPRTALAELSSRLDSGRNVYWDPSFADSLAKGTPQ